MTHDFDDLCPCEDCRQEFFRRVGRNWLERYQFAMIDRAREIREAQEQQKQQEAHRAA